MSAKSTHYEWCSFPDSARKALGAGLNPTPDDFTVVMRVDRLTQGKRSWLMSRVRSHGNKSTEVALAKLLRRHLITGWRRHQPVFGKPDFIFRVHRLAVFVDGCFWHACPKHSKIPATNRNFWTEKLSRNAARDRHVARALGLRGWRIVRIWEHDLQTRPQRVVSRILRALGADG